MTLFLTSHIGGWKRRDKTREPEPLFADNGLVENLKARWKGSGAILFIAASPDDFERNDSIQRTFSQAFPMSGLPIRGITVCDSRNVEAVNRLEEFDVIILSGGHVPTQNTFFTHIGLKEKLQNYPGIVIGISAGTMNCAKTVYAQPELDGEAIDPAYRRFLPGLGLTSRMILPHYQAIKDNILDGLRVFEDIAYPDSFGRTFYALGDGSYILSENGAETLYGEAYRIQDGMLTKICEKGASFRLKNIQS